MKKQAGFTLVEIMVAMLVTLIILGGLVSLLGSSLTSHAVGMDQKEAYEEARVLMNEIKTTLRYAKQSDSSPVNPNPQEPVVNTAELSYTSSIYKTPMNIEAGTLPTNYTVSIKWSADKKQIIYEKVDSANNKTTITFPKNVKNSGFIRDYAGKFPVISEEYLGEKMYLITLPVVYKSGGSEQLEVLQTRVAPYKETESEESIPLVGNKAADALIKASMAADAQYYAETKKHVGSADSSAANLTHSGLAGWAKLIAAALGTNKINVAWAVERNSNGSYEIYVCNNCYDNPRTDVKTADGYKTGNFEDGPYPKVDPLNNTGHLHIRINWWFKVQKFSYNENGELQKTEDGYASGKSNRVTNPDDYTDYVDTRIINKDSFKKEKTAISDKNACIDFDYATE